MNYKRFGDISLINIAYSALKDTNCPPNTVEVYEKACTFGFNALKGDVRPTKDGNLVMCHDSGFTLNESGKIVAFDSGNCVQIAEMTLEEVLALEYEDCYETLGYYARPATFEQFVSVCKENDKICHPTLRDGNIDIVIQKVLSILADYEMEDKTIINSMTLATLQRFREYNDDIQVCFTLQAKEQITKKHVDDVIALGDAVLDGFNFPFEGCYDKVEAASEAIAYAKEKGVRLFQAQINTREEYEWAIEKGFTGFHIMYPIL